MISKFEVFCKIYGNLFCIIPDYSGQNTIPIKSCFALILGQSMNSAGISTYPLPSTTPLLLLFIVYLSIKYKVNKMA